MRNVLTRLAVVFIAALQLGIAHGAGQITILTSFPKEIPDTYKAAFEKKYPDIKVEVLNLNTKKAIAHIRETAVGERPDILWVSAPDAFEVLAREKLLVKLGADVGNPRIPNRVGIYPVNDPDGFYKGQALSGYGIMWNKNYAHTHQLPTAYQWEDLAKPAYFGHVAMSSPSRSGTTHLTVETILQGEGWDKGWAQLLEIGGNCAAITESSTDVPKGVNSGKFGFGLVIDFFGLSGKYTGNPVDFSYPRMTAVVPANIGLIVGGKNSADAKKFINFSLSQEGQELLFNPKIARLPALPEAYISGNMPSGYPNVFRVAFLAKVRFKSELSESRYALVAALFDQAITLRLKELQAATKAVHDAEKKLSNKFNPAAEKLLKEARVLAFTPVVNAATASGSDFLEGFNSAKKKADKKLTAQEESWGLKIAGNYEKATQLANQAAALIR